MNRFESEDSIGSALFIMRVVMFALIVGVSMFLGFVISQGALSLPPQGSLIASLGIIAAAIALVTRFFTPALFRTPRQADAADEQFLRILFNRYLVNIAILEGAAYLNVHALQAEHNWWSLLIVNVLLLAILMLFPTRTRLEQFLETARMDASL